MKASFVIASATKDAFVALHLSTGRVLGVQLGFGGADHERMRKRISELELRRHSRHGVIRVAMLERLGLARQTAYRRCVPGGPWQRLLPGIALLSNAPPTRRQLVEAALLYAGPDAVVTGLEACQRHGLRAVPDGPTIHILVPHERHVKSSDHVLVERTIRLPTPLMRDDVPLAPLVRAVLDACRRLRKFDPSRALITEAVQRGRVSPHALDHELSLGSRRGTSVPREILRDVLDGARSVAEIDGLRMWKRTGLPAPAWNVDLFDQNGRFIARPDAWCDEVGLAWEIDSYEFHFGRGDYARTLERNTRYAAAGIVLVQTLPNRLRSEPQLVAAQPAGAQTGVVESDEGVHRRAGGDKGRLHRFPTRCRSPHPNVR